MKQKLKIKKTITPPNRCTTFNLWVERMLIDHKIIIGRKVEVRF